MLISKGKMTTVDKGVHKKCIKWDKKCVVMIENLLMRYNICRLEEASLPDFLKHREPEFHCALARCPGTHLI